jgi:dipeptidyl aminopeptidase/acylaminoacyl peptidase
MRCHLCILTTILALSGPAATGAENGLTPRQLAGLRTMTDAELAPDGQRIAAVRSVPRALFDEDDGTSWAELVVIDRDSDTVRGFITGQVNVSQVDWRPDSAAISFVATRHDDEHACLYAIPVAGGEAARIVTLNAPVLAYSWGPDSARVALVATEPQPTEDEELSQHGFTQRVVEEGVLQRKLWVAETDGDDTTLRRLDLPGSVIQVSWSPGGGSLAVSIAPTPAVDDRYMAQTIHVVDIAEEKIVATVDHAGKLRTIAWSPDGGHLAFIAGADAHDPAASSLFVVGADGGAPVNLTRDREATATDLAWADADSLYLLEARGVTTEISRVARDGTSWQELGVGGSGVVIRSLDARPGHDTIAAVASSASHPGEVFSWRPGEPAPRRLTDGNPWLADVPLGRQEVVRWQARDELELEGLLIHPLSSGDGRPAPLVVVVHGGPESHRSDGWLTRYHSPGQVLAARGFAVFYPNYRGSTGRGVAFSQLGQRDAAGAEFDDIVDGVDHLVAAGVADPDRVGVTGGSYGGYATAWLSTVYSDRFAAGVMFVGIANKISKSGTTDIPNEEYLVHARVWPWQAWQHFLERSPLYHVEKGRSPLLILHGEDDPRVSVTQSREMHRALKTLGNAPVRLVIYPGEGHGNRRTASRYDLSLRLVRWMEHYLKGAGGEPPDHRLRYRAPQWGWAAE